MKNIKGFSLVEVLVAVVIMSTALLGLVGLQAAGVKNIITSYNRTQASQLASSMADRIRANVADITAGTSNYITIDPTTATAKSNCLTTSGCSAADMAENDLYQWNRALKDSSNGLVKTGTITRDAGNCPIQITVTVSWSEGRDDNKDDATDDDLALQTLFQIPC